QEKEDEIELRVQNVHNLSEAPQVPDLNPDAQKERPASAPAPASLPERGAAKGKGFCIVVQSALATPRSISKLKTLLEKYRGQEGVVLKIAGEGGRVVTINCTDCLKVSKNKSLIEGVKELFGSDCIGY
ncbi:MAG: hypothetical protein IIT80_00155, partial [Aeriscardovia sp.]|nr:hypothetical protein [Aeriscardovia sp.]